MRFKSSNKFIGRLKKWPKLNPWGYWSKVLINTTIYASFTFLVTILLYHFVVFCWNLANFKRIRIATRKGTGKWHFSLIRGELRGGGGRAGGFTLECLPRRQIAWKIKPCATSFLNYFTQHSPLPIALWNFLSSYPFPILKSFIHLS